MGVKFSLQYTQQKYSKSAETLVFYNIQNTTPYSAIYKKQI